MAELPLGELLDAVEIISSFKEVVKSIKSTLEIIKPLLKIITDLNEKLSVLVRDGLDLVDKCSKVHPLNFFMKAQYSQRLDDFDNKLLSFFVTLLQLKQFEHGNEPSIFWRHNCFRHLRAEVLLTYNPSESKCHSKEEIRILIGTMNTIMKSMEDKAKAKAEAMSGVLVPTSYRPVFGMEAYSDEPVMTRQERARAALSTMNADNNRKKIVGTMGYIVPVFGMEAYSDEPDMTRQERAGAALSTMNANNKKEIVLSYVDSLKKQFGTGVSTKCILYNATGDTVHLVGKHNWFGKIGPANYLSQIENGQWGGFLHVKKTVLLPLGSVGAVVYRGKNLNDEDCDWMLSWSNPWSRLFQDNCVYTEIREAGHFEQNHWGYINGKLESSGKIHNDNWNGCSSSMTSGTGTTVVVEVIMTLENA